MHSEIIRRPREGGDPYLSCPWILVLWTPCSVSRPVRAGNHHGVPVGIAHPAFPVIWPAVAVGRISMFGHDNLHVHLGGALHDRVKVVHLEPQSHAVSVGLVISIAYRAVMVFHFEAVQLKDQLAVRDQLLIYRAAMIAPAAQQPLIPSAAGFHIGHGNERLRPHLVTVTHYPAVAAAITRLYRRQSCLTAAVLNHRNYALHQLVSDLGG